MHDTLNIMNNLILLSFDVEEFDVPLEYGHSIDPDTQMSVTASGLERVLTLLESHGITATFFVTANFAIRHPELICKMGEHYEIASHGFLHSKFKNEDLLESRIALERIIGKPVQGFRRARLLRTDLAAVREAGYQYTSSENPTWIPGRYNNLMRPRRPHNDGQLQHFPISTVPYCRFPLFWLSFKIVPPWILQLGLRAALRSDGSLVIYFHPWEFTDISGFKLPSYVSRFSGNKMIGCLSWHIRRLADVGEFTTFAEYCESREPGSFANQEDLR